MWRYVSTDELYHYGVKGMKWGVRKKRHVNHTRTSTNNKQHTKKMSTTTKVAIGVGVAATVAVGVHFAKKYMDMNCDKVIPKGTNIQRMSRNVEQLFDAPFYASHLKSDNKSYAKNDLFGTNWKYRETLTSTSDIKIAGKKTAINAFQDWVKNDPVGRKNFPDLDVSNKRNVRDVYDKFNRNFSSPDMRDKAVRDSYFSKLMEKGYSAVRDRNDQTYSKKRSPIMIFDKFGDILVKDIVEAAQRG